MVVPVVLAVALSDCINIPASQHPGIPASAAAAVSSSSSQQQQQSGSLTAAVRDGSSKSDIE